MLFPTSHAFREGNFGCRPFIFLVHRFDSMPVSISSHMAATTLLLFTAVFQFDAGGGLRLFPFRFDLIVLLLLHILSEIKEGIYILKNITCPRPLGIENALNALGTCYWINVHFWKHHNVSGPLRHYDENRALNRDIYSAFRSYPPPLLFCIIYTPGFIC